MAINYFSSGNELLSIANIDIIIFCQSADSPDYVINKQLIVRYQQPILSINIKWVVEKWRNSHSAIFLSLDKTELAFISLLDAYENEKQENELIIEKNQKRNNNCHIRMGMIGGKQSETDTCRLHKKSFYCWRV